MLENHLTERLSVSIPSSLSLTEPGVLERLFRLACVARARSGSSVPNKVLVSFFVGVISSRRPLRPNDRSNWKLGIDEPFWRRARRIGEEGGKNEGRSIDRNSSRASDGRGDLIHVQKAKFVRNCMTSQTGVSNGVMRRLT